MPGFGEAFGVSESEVEIWKGWGMHVLTEGNQLEDYTAEQFRKAEQEPGVISSAS